MKDGDKELSFNFQNINQNLEQTIWEGIHSINYLKNQENIFSVDQIPFF